VCLCVCVCVSAVIFVERQTIVRQSVENKCPGFNSAFTEHVVIQP